MYIPRADAVARANHQYHLSYVFFSSSSKACRMHNSIIHLIHAAELGDFDPHRYKPGYVSEFRFLAHQSPDLETKIAELHKTMR